VRPTSQTDVSATGSFCLQPLEISRAQCLAVVVADPRIASTPVNYLSKMALVNLFCKLIKS
jgi:hypothetical protein